MPHDAVLLTGSTGYIGGRLLPHLLDGGVAPRLLVRDGSRVPECGTDAGLDVVIADLNDADSLGESLEGVAEAYYLVHSMEPGVGDGFAERDRRSAQNYAVAAEAAGVRRTIYLGGVAPEDASSDHLSSRREVEEILGDATAEFVGLRASMIVGAGSGSFATLARIVARLPVLPLPSWRDRRTQPIAIDDVVRCLSSARQAEPGVYEIAGPDALSFEEMTGIVADLLGKPHRTVPVPLSHAGIEGAAAAAISEGDRELLEPLMEGLHDDLLIDDNSAESIFGVTPMPFREAARAALDELDL